MEENFCKQSYRKRKNLQNVQTAHKAQKKKKNTVKIWHNI